VHEVQVDVQEVGLIGGGVDDVAIPELLGNNVLGGSVFGGSVFGAFAMGFLLSQHMRR